MSFPSVETRNLGSQGLKASCMGLGCMGMSAFYKDTTGSHSGEEESIATIHRAKELGVTFLGKQIALANNRYKHSVAASGVEVMSEQLNAHSATCRPFFTLKVTQKPHRTHVRNIFIYLMHAYTDPGCLSSHIAYLTVCR